MSINPEKPATELNDQREFGPDAATRSQIIVALHADNHAQVHQLLETLHPADYANLLLHLSPEDRNLLLDTAKDKLSLRIVIELPAQLRHLILDEQTPEQLVEDLKTLESDDVIDILHSLSKDALDQVLERLSAETRRAFEKTRLYPEESAGRLMQREIAYVPEHWTIKEVKAYLYDQKSLPSYFYHVYVVDPRHHPIGKIALSRLLRLDDDCVVRDVMRDNLEVFKVEEDQEDVAQTFHHYGLVSAPVTSQSGRLVGMITVDDIVDVIQKEAEEDILQLGGLQGASDFYAPVFTTAYWRIRWLLVTLLNALIASYVISLFEGSIQQITALSFLMTINAAMGGNSGMQVVTVVVRALATKSLKTGEHWRAVYKELRVGTITGISCALLLALVTSLWIGDPRLGILLFAALLSNMLWAAFAGTLLPIVIDRLGMDPAVSAGPLLTTTTDILGYAVFLGLATLLLL